MISPNFPAVIILLKHDISKDEEITVNYNWEKKNRGYLSVCGCSSKCCKLFVEQDAAQLMDKVINKVRIINSSDVGNTMTTLADSSTVSGYYHDLYILIEPS